MKKLLGKNLDHNTIQKTNKHTKPVKIDVIGANFMYIAYYFYLERQNFPGLECTLQYCSLSPTLIHHILSPVQAWQYGRYVSTA